MFWTLVALILLFLGLLQFSFFQTWLSKQITDYISKATSTRVTAEKLMINPFQGIVLQNFNVMGQQEDTIFHAGALTLSLRKNLFNIFYNTVDLSYVGIKDVDLNIVTEWASSKSNLDLFLERLALSPSDPSKKGKPIDLQLKEIELSDIQVKMLNKNKGKYQELALASGVVEINYLDMVCREIDIVSIVLDHPLFETHIYEDDCEITEDLTIEPKGVPRTMPASWSLDIGELIINRGRFGSFNHLLTTELKYKKYLDYNNFFFENINLYVEGFSLDDEGKMTTHLKTLSATDNTGFEIHQIKSDTLVFSNTGLELAGFSILMGNTKIKNRLKMSFADLKAFSNFTEEVVLNANLVDTKIYLEDLIHFVRSLSRVPIIQKNAQEIVSINGRYFGKVANIAGRDVDIQLGQKLSLAGSFSTRDLLDSDNTVLNIRLDRFNTSMQKLKMILPTFNPPANFYKLGSIRFEGRFDGYLEDFVAYGNVKTDLGNADVDMRLDITQGSDKANYSGTLNLKNFNLGTWSDNKELGLVNFNSKVEEGKGLTLNTVKANLEATIKSLTYKKYEYRDVVLDGILDKNTFKGAFKVQDENVDFIFEGSMEYLNQQAFLNFKSTINKLDLQALNLSKQPLSIQANMDINLSGSDINDFIGKINLSQVALKVKDSLYQLDKVDLSSNNLAIGGKEISLESDLGGVKLEGQYDITNLIRAVKKVIYTNTTYLTTAWKDDVALLKKDQKFDFSVRLEKSKNFLSLLGLSSSYFRNLNIKGRLDTYKSELLLASNIPYFRLKNDSIQDLQLQVSSNRLAGSVSLHIDSTFAIGKRFNPIDIITTSSGDTINFDLTTEKVIDSLENFDIHGQLIPHTKGYNLTLRDNLLSMLGTKWTINGKNNMVFGKEYLYFEDMILSDGFRSLEFNDFNQNRGLSLDLENFDIDIVNGIIKYDKMKFAGLTSVSLKVHDVFNKDKSISLYVQTPRFNINKDAYGAVYIEVTKQAGTPYNAYISIGDFLGVKGTYDEKNQVIDTKIKLRDAPMPILQYLLKGGIKDTGGFIDADFTFGGPLKSPKIEGEGTIKKGKTTVLYTMTTYYFDQQKVRLTNTKINLDGAIITDQNGSQGLINGGLTHDMFTNFGVDAIISGKNVVGLNTTKADNPDYYGYGIGQLTAEFKGPFDQLNININAVTTAGTKLFIPVDDNQAALNKSFIKFSKKGSDDEDKVKKKAFKLEGFNIEMTMTITPEAEVSLIFNESKGDIIKGNGNGNLKIYITRQGDFDIFGEYEIERGEYLFTVALLPVAKPFQVQRGGLVKWTGDPIDATLDITAKYRTKTTLEPFISEYLTIDQVNQTLARQNTDVDVQLKLQGSLFKPEIGFDLSFPNVNGDIANFVESKLRLLKNNVQELNGQVLGLIVFNSFLPSNRISDVFGASGLQTASINTLSEFLTSQFSLYITNALNSLVKEGGLLSGVDVDVNVRNNTFGFANSGFIPSEVAINNKFVFKDNRFSLDLGGNYVYQNQGQIINQVLPDFAVEFVLTEDRKIKVRLYGKYDIDLSTIAVQAKYGVGVAYRTEFGNMVKVDSLDQQ